MKRLFTILPVVLLVALMVVFATQLNKGPQNKSDLFTGKLRPAPELTLTSLEGHPFELASYQGAPVFVNLWATWCAPCEIEHPVLLDMAARGAPIIGIVYKDDPATASLALQNAGNPFIANAQDVDGVAGLSLGVNSVPETFLIDAGGMIVHQHRGPLAPEDADALLEKYEELKETISVEPAA